MCYIIMNTNTNIIALSLIVFLLINPISKYLVGKSGKQINNYKLPDIFHSDKFNLKPISFFNEIIIVSLIIQFIYYISIEKIPYNDVILFIKYFTILLLIKIILMNVTILPDPSKRCKNGTNIFTILFMGGCNDLIFSLHMTIVLLILHFLKKNKLITEKYAMIYSLLQAFFIIFTHNHYTIDVILAFIITSFVINGNYHI